MNSTQRVQNALTGKPVDRQPIYGWVAENLRDEISARFGSVEDFEDHYAFDVAHIFGGPWSFSAEKFDRIRSENEELTPDVLLEYDLFADVSDADAYKSVKKCVEHHKQRERFCYMQTPGFFEHFNTVFGIQDHLLYLALYPDELRELYRRQAEWTVAFADQCIDAGVDMIHISDDWGSQKDMLFSPKTWRELICPNLKTVVDHVHKRGAFVSLHSDGCIAKVTNGVAQLGIDVLHPWQENAGMPLSLYLENYADRFALMGGICVQSALGILPRDKLEREIRRVFGLLRNKRWICCTSHFVQKHCTMEDLIFAYDLIYKLARE